MTVETANQVRKLCLAIRTRTDNYSVDIKHWLHDLENLAEYGWSPDTLPILQLCNDAGTLEDLADSLMAVARTLGKMEKPNESA